MRTPSNRTGVPGVPVVVLLALILFLGLALSPRAFEFRGWPEPARNDAIEEVVARPVPEAPRIEVAGLRPEVGDDDPGQPSTARRSSLDRRRTEVAHTPRRSARRDRSGRRGRPDRSAAAPDAAVDTPAAPSAQPGPDPQEPAQVAEVPATDTVLRPDPERYVPPPVRSLVGDDEGDDGDGDNGNGRDKGNGGPGRWSHGDHGDGGHHGRGHDGAGSSD